MYVCHLLACVQKIEQEYIKGEGNTEFEVLLCYLE